MSSLTNTIFDFRKNINPIFKKNLCPVLSAKDPEHAIIFNRLLRALLPFGISVISIIESVILPHPPLPDTLYTGRGFRKVLF